MQQGTNMILSSVIVLRVPLKPQEMSFSQSFKHLKTVPNYNKLG